MPKKLPPEFEVVRERCLRALGDLRAADNTTKAPKNFLFNAARTTAGRSLPAYYLVYFLLVDLLGFKDLGKFEKVAWSIPLDFKGSAFLVEHRKMGLGVFASDLPAQEEQAKEIVKRITKAVRLAEPYFEWLADQAAAASLLNVANHSTALFERYEYFHNAYRKKAQEAEARKDDVVVDKPSRDSTFYHFPAFDLLKEADWFALAAIESFFSWTEHIFIHIAILKGKATTGDAVAELAESDWADKFKAAIPLTDKKAKEIYDKLVAIRRQLRNAVAHGAFGKNGAAFHFHSGAGAVPLLLPHKRGKDPYRFGDGMGFIDKEAIDTLEDFATYVWLDDREPAKLYIQGSSLPLILTMATDGSYAQAMTSTGEMKDCIDALNYQFDTAANMDW